MPRQPAPSFPRESAELARRGLVASLLGLAAFLIATELFAQRVVLVRPPDPDALLGEAFTRLRAELLLQRFEVVVVSAEGGLESPESLASTAQRAQAFAAIALARRAGARSADVWLADRVTGKTTLRTLALDRESDAPSVLAVRAVDLLRSSLRELGPGESPPPEVRDVDRGPVPEPVRKFSAPEAPFALRLLGVALLEAGLGSAFGPGAGLEHRLSERFRVGFLLAGPLLGASFDARRGRALLRQELGAVEATLVVLRYHPLEWGVVGGVGVYHLEARAEVDPPLSARSDQVTSALASAGISFRVALTKTLGFGVEGTAVALAPRPGVAILDERTLFRLPLLHAGMGLTVAF